MELFETNKHFIVVNGSVALFCDRLSGQIFFGESAELSYEWNPVCLGQIKGVIGKIKFIPDGESKLILINKIESVGKLPIIGHVYRVTKISIISLSVQPISNLDIDLCKSHHFGLKKTEKITTSPDIPKPIFKAFQEHMKSAAESVKPKRKDIRDKEKFERRMLEEFDKMFQDGTNSTDCFYICCDPETSCDITSNIQKQKSDKYVCKNPLWRRSDDRFFWNKTMLQEAIDSADRLLIQKFGKCVFQSNNELSESDSSLAMTMIRHLEEILMPIIQGFVQVEPFSLHVPTHSPISKNIPNMPQIDMNHEYKLIVGLISRRNRYRAGTRFRRRGVDVDGNVANYVETEQILRVENDKSPHVVSFVQIRGSVPVFWSQFSLKYRPPIILEKSDEENQTAFQKHFVTEFNLYDKVVVVNLVDTGIERSERKISDAYLHHLIQLNSSQITCVMFDFHDYCRGLQFDNVSILMKGVMEIFRDMKYTWVDKNGMICEQKSIFRVNCVDCLDRTNVVQCMLAGVVIETQLRKLGLLSPEESLPNNFYQIMQFMWANNGDAISRQYSGTAAMKGDFTRTGTRTMNGLVKDGMSSVNRYYLRLREMSRQAALDLMTGNDDSSEIINLRNGRSDTEQKLLKQKEENIKELAAQCKKACLKSDEECLAESILIYCNENDKEFHDMNTVALMTVGMLYFVSNLIPLPNERIDYQQKRQPLAIGLPLQWIRKIQIGYEPMLFRSNQPMIRIFYDPPNLTTEKMTKTRSKNKLLDMTNNMSDENLCDTHFLAFKQPSLRLFNNLLVEVKKNSDMVEALKAVAESFYLAAKSSNANVQFDEAMVKFEKIKSECIPSEWTFPININLIYANVVLSSSFTALNYDYDEMMNLREDVNECLEQNDQRLAEEDVVVKEKEGLKPMDMIKQGISRVKDKVKIRDWKDRLTFSTKNAPLLKLPTEEPQINVETPDVTNIVRKGSFDIRWQTKNELDHIINSSLKKENQQFLSASRGRLGSTSDDENSRRPANSQFGDFSLKKVKSDLFKFDKKGSGFGMEDNFESSNEDDNFEFAVKDFLEKECPLEMNIKDVGASPNIEENDFIKLNKSIFSSFNNIDKIAKKVERKDEFEEPVLESCGIINSNSNRTKLKNAILLPFHVNAQLAAATGGAYQRRAERISLQLSIDDSPNEPRHLESLIMSPLLPRRSLFISDALAESCSNNQVAPDEDFTDICSTSVDIQNISYIQLAPVDIRNIKVAERLTQKQIQLALFVESLRKKLLDPNQSLSTGMIIF